MISELRSDKSDWPWFVKLVDHAINHRPQRRLAGHALVTAMTGLPADNPVDVIFCNPKSLAISSVQIESEQIAKSMENLQESLNIMLKGIASSTETERQPYSECKSRHGTLPNFGIGDYVLVAKPDSRTANKLDFMWHGPYKIVDTHQHRSYVFTVENLLYRETEEVRGDRMQFYCGKFLNVTEEILKQFQHDTGNRQVDKICDASLNWSSTDVEYLVK